jgi:copper(I)-binding protein
MGVVRRPGPAWLVGTVAAAVLVAVACGGGDPAAPPAVRDGWAVPVGTESAAAYLTITAAEGDELTAARVERDVAARVEIVNPEDAAEDGPGHLGHLDPGGSLGGDHGHAVELPADRVVVLEPAGAYLALGPLAGPLAPGDTFPLTLSFREAADVTVDVTVRTEPPA